VDFNLIMPESNEAAARAKLLPLFPGVKIEINRCKVPDNSWPANAISSLATTHGHTAEMQFVGAMLDCLCDSNHSKRLYISASGTGEQPTQHAQVSCRS